MLLFLKSFATDGVKKLKDSTNLRNCSNIKKVLNFCQKKFHSGIIT